MLAIRLPEEILQRLATLAAKTGRTKTYYAREAILRHLDDLEDTYLAMLPPIEASRNVMLSETYVKLKSP